jgi:hypothetical protein
MDKLVRIQERLNEVIFGDDKILEDLHQKFLETFSEKKFKTMNNFLPLMIISKEFYIIYPDSSPVRFNFYNSNSGIFIYYGLGRRKTVLIEKFCGNLFYKIIEFGINKNYIPRFMSNDSRYAHYALNRKKKWVKRFLSALPVIILLEDYYEKAKSQEGNQ